MITIFTCSFCLISAALTGLGAWLVLRPKSRREWALVILFLVAAAVYFALICLGVIL